MKLKPFVIQPADRQAPLNVVGTQVTVLASRDNSRDQRITLQSGSEGQGPPPHGHEWDESFFVSSGTILFTCAGETTMCGAGTFVHVPAGTVHSFAYGPDGGEMLEITGGQSKAIEMFSTLDREARMGATDVEKAVEVLGDHGVAVYI